VIPSGGKAWRNWNEMLDDRKETRMLVGKTCSVGMVIKWAKCG